MTHVCLFFSQTHHKPAAWSYFSSTSLFGSGRDPPLEFKEEKCTCWSAREIIQKQSYMCFLFHFALILNTLVFQPVRFYTSAETVKKHKIILWAPISPLPGRIGINHVARLQTISLRKTIANCGRAQKAINLNFFPLWMNLLKNWIHSARQENISGTLWACQGCTERCVSKAIFVSLRPMVKAGQRDPRSIAGL